MFHTLVTARSGRQIDVDRARYLMDDALFAEAHRDLIKFMSPVGFNPFDIACAEHNYSPGFKEHRVWRVYCALHEAKYGEPFEPDVSETWDS